MRKKNGFTLIELLAAVTVLIIIVLIAIPTVTKVSDEIKRRAFENSAYGIIKAGELYHSSRKMNGEELVDKVFEFPNNIYGLEFEGDVPKNGSMKITAEGDIVLALSNGKYCITKQSYSSQIEVTKDTNNCVLPKMIYSNLMMKSENKCIRDGICPSGTKVNVQVNSTQNYDFYVISDDGKELTLIMDRNLGDTVAWYADAADNSHGPITAINYLDELTDKEWSNIPKKSYTYSGLDKDGTTIIYQDITKIMRARMITYGEATYLGCTNSAGSCPSWLYENLDYDSNTSFPHSYHTSNALVAVATNAYYVNDAGCISFGAHVNTTTIGVRPVIELSK